MVYFFITLILFSSLEVVSKPLMQFIDPFSLTFFRFIMGFIILTCFMFIKKRGNEISRIDRKTMSFLALLGFLNVFFSMSMLQLAVKNSNAATAAVIFCSNPLFVFFISVIIKKEKFSYKKVFGFLLGISGILLVMSSKGFKMEMGAIYAMLASISFAGYTIINKKTVKSVQPLIVNVVSFFWGLTASALYLIFSGKGISFPITILDSSANILRFLFLGVFISAIGYITFIDTIKKLSPVSASVIFLLKPAVATLFALIFLNESLNKNFYTGLFLTILGSLFVLKRKNNDQN